MEEESETQRLANLFKVTEQVSGRAESSLYSLDLHSSMYAINGPQLAA